LGKEVASRAHKGLKWSAMNCLAPILSPARAANWRAPWHTQRHRAPKSWDSNALISTFAMLMPCAPSSKPTAPIAFFNGAAYNLVDKAESEGARAALEVNALGPAVLAAACRDMNAKLVHFSTDFVFDGTITTPYNEDDKTNPLGVYAASKLCGENVVLAASPRHLVIRVCRLFGPVDTQTQKPGGNFPLLMVKLGRERGKVRVVDDQVGFAELHARPRARRVGNCCKRCEGGVFHLSNAGEISFADYAREIFKIANVECEVEGVSSAQYGAPAARPLYSTLSNDKAHSVGVTPLRHWREALGEFLRNHA
jgi:dTDP-4-dehydrorhamnose reductase